MTFRLTSCTALSPPKAFDTLRDFETLHRRSRPRARSMPRSDDRGRRPQAASPPQVARRRDIRSFTFQNTPSGASRMTTTIAIPYTTPWMPGMTLPSRACSTSLNGTSTSAPITGPHTVPTPPNIATISACADTSMPNTAGGVTTSSTTA